MKGQMKMSSETTGGPVLQHPHPHPPPLSLSTLVEKPSSFGGKTCSGGGLPIWKNFLKCVVTCGFETRKIFFLLSCDRSHRYFLSLLYFETPKYWLKNMLYMGQCSCFKIDVGQLERIRKNTDKESKINSVNCLLAAWKQESSPLPLDPGLFPTGFLHANCPRQSTAESWGHGGLDTWGGQGTQYRMLSTCVAFSLCWESKTRKAALANRAEILSVCGVTLLCILLCKQLNISWFQMLPSTACPHPQPIVLAVSVTLPCSVYPQAFTILEMLMKTSQLNEGKMYLPKTKKWKKPPKTKPLLFTENPYEKLLRDVCKYAEV